MEITLEQIDLIRQRTGAGYKEAREVLEAAGGRIVDALVLLEGREGMEYDECAPPAGRMMYAETDDDQEGQNGRKGMGMLGHNRMVSGLMNFSKKSKIKITLPGDRKVEIPAVLGAAGVVMAPKVAALSGLALLLTKCSLSMDYARGNGQSPENPESRE
jgi:hypothetical protein